LTTVKKQFGKNGMETIDTIAQAIIALTDVRLEASLEEAVYKPKGTPVEVGLM
jgi:hypothetical protein